jgi:hypothetical protein
VASSRRSLLWVLGIKRTPKVPRLVIDFNRFHFDLCERNIFMTLYLNDAAFARNRLFEKSSVFEFDRDELVA